LRFLDNELDKVGKASALHPIWSDKGVREGGDMRLELQFIYHEKIQTGFEPLIEGLEKFFGLLESVTMSRGRGPHSKNTRGDEEEHDEKKMQEAPLTERIFLRRDEHLLFYRYYLVKLLGPEGFGFVGKNAPKFEEDDAKEDDSPLLEELEEPDEDTTSIVEKLRMATRRIEYSLEKEYPSCFSRIKTKILRPWVFELLDKPPSDLLKEVKDSLEIEDHSLLQWVDIKENESGEEYLERMNHPLEKTAKKQLQNIRKMKDTLDRFCDARFAFIRQWLYVPGFVNRCASSSTSTHLCYRIFRI